MSSPAERWFERFKTEGWSLVEELVNDSHYETLHLDFNSVRDGLSGRSEGAVTTPKTKQ